MILLEASVFEHGFLSHGHDDTGGYLAQSSLQPRLVDTEIAILKVLNHPHVLQLYEVYFEPSTTAPR